MRLAISIFIGFNTNELFKILYFNNINKGLKPTKLYDTVPVETEVCQGALTRRMARSEGSEGKRVNRHQERTRQTLLTAKRK